MNLNNKQIFVFIGPPGSGKGSLSQACVKELGWAQLSTGDLCRHHIADGTELGKQIDFFIRSGKLIPDALMIDMVEKWLLEKLNSLDVLILDGFPRTVIQAEALDSLLKKEAFSTVHLQIVRLEIADENVVHRMMSRLVCPQCGTVYSKEHEELKPKCEMLCDRCHGVALIVRSDDTADSIQHRLMIYHKHAQELLGYYQKQDLKKVAVLDAHKPLQDVFVDFVKMIGLKVY
jgi:adenylate kinase